MGNKTKTFLKEHGMEVAVIGITAGLSIGVYLICKKAVGQITNTALENAVRNGISYVCSNLDSAGHVEALNDLVSKGIVARIA